ncbi:MAG: hypothetical protein V4801_26170 [Burkholderia gladioli]
MLLQERVVLIACIGFEENGAVFIEDEPPPEVAAAGHDRCIIPIKPESVEAWLNPDPSDLASAYAILDDRHRPYYEHKLAA